MVVPIPMPLDGVRFKSGFSMGLGWHMAAAIVGAMASIIAFLAKAILATIFRPPIPTTTAIAGTIFIAKMFV